jgi:divalent metal cation (Fe/Co/Zn/Cd) transporter
VLITLVVLAVWPGGWWLDPAVGLAISAVALWEGIKSWRGEQCNC